MNKKFLVLLTTGTLLLTSLTAAGCASKKNNGSEMIPTTTAVIETTETAPEADPMSQDTEEAVVIKPVDQTEPEVSAAETIETEDLVKTAQEASTKKTAKKTAKKTTKKTAKKTTKKTTKKTAKKTTKKTSAKTSKKTTGKFTYGSSTYGYNNICIYLTIKKNNSVDFAIGECRYNAADIQYEIVWKGTGTLNPKTNTITYKSSTKSMNFISGKGERLKTQYQNGSGKFILNGKTLKWNDSVDHKGNNFKFVKL